MICGPPIAAGSYIAATEAAKAFGAFVATTLKEEIAMNI